MNGYRKYRNGRHSKAVRHVTDSWRRGAVAWRGGRSAGRRSLNTECRSSDTRQINNSSTGALDTLNRHSKYTPSLSIYIIINRDRT